MTYRWGSFSSKIRIVGKPVACMHTFRQDEQREIYRTKYYIAIGSPVGQVLKDVDHKDMEMVHPSTAFCLLPSISRCSDHHVQLESVFHAQSRLFSAEQNTIRTASNDLAIADLWQDLLALRNSCLLHAKPTIKYWWWWWTRNKKMITQWDTAFQ